ncbi:MAG: ketopantoate reductase family protein [Solirubrobacterales bacterium]
MNYLIIGTGGVGGALGGFLASSGHNVDFIAHGKTLDELKNKGLKIKSGIKGEIFIPNVNAYSIEGYDNTADVIFICVKYYSIKGIISLLKKASDKSVIIPLLNGYGIGEKLRQETNMNNIIDGCIYISSYVEAPGSIVQLGSLFKLVFGAVNGNYESLDIIKNDLLNSGVEAIISNNIEQDLFKKFSFVSSCAACGAYYDAAAGLIQSEEKYKNTFIELCREIDAIGKKLNFKFYPDLTEVNLKTLYTLPKDATSSLYKDIKSGQRSEVDSLIFKVVSLGEELGVETPTYKIIADHFGYK